MEREFQPIYQRTSRVVKIDEIHFDACRGQRQPTQVEHGCKPKVILIYAALCQIATIDQFCGSLLTP